MGLSAIPLVIFFCRSPSPSSLPSWIRTSFSPLQVRTWASLPFPFLQSLPPRDQSGSSPPYTVGPSTLISFLGCNLTVQFSNGKLQNPGNMRFTLYKSNDSTNPRKKSQRILAAETDRLSYVGNNFGTGALKCNTLCRHFVGVLNKTSGQMEVYDAELFNMQPLFSDESIESESTQESQTKTFREKMDSCIEAFGTTKQKRALNSRRMNSVGSESLNCAVAKAAENIIDAKGVTALVSDAIHDDLHDDSLYLPPCHADATKPEDVYKFEDLLSTTEYEALRSPSEAFRNVSSEEILKMIEENSHCSFVIEALKSLPSDEESRDRQARCIWFLDTLIKFRAQKVIKRKSALGPGVPHIINTKLLKHFTCLTYNNGRSEQGRGGGRPWSVDWLLRPQTLLRRAPAALCRGLGSSPLRKPYILSALSPLETLTLGALGSPAVETSFKEPFLISHRTRVPREGSVAGKGRPV
uniref:RNA polymerase I subunit E n=1 Tax=Ursus maritimus TaxID=29073 RepID=A0A452U4N7_URSMA